MDEEVVQVGYVFDREEDRDTPRFEQIISMIEELYSIHHILPRSSVLQLMGSHGPTAARKIDACRWIIYHDITDPSVRHRVIDCFAPGMLTEFIHISQLGF
jgi:hypothetical protein